jgi:4-aminobutyrate aminotransferase
MKMQPETCSEYCLYKLEKAIMKHKGNVAAIFIEPILGEHGYVVPPKSFIKGLRSLCDEHNILLCDDEVQAGCYRTGKFLAIENFNVKPDVVSLSKALSNGLPIGVTVANKKLMDWPAGAHANTFGGNLLACAAGIATLKYMKKHKLGKNAKRTGNYIIRYLNELKDKYAIIGDVRGIGLMIGIEISKKGSTKPDIKTRDKILHKCFSKGLLMLPAGDSVIRICPPLTITQKEADKGLEIIENVIKIINK